MPFSIASTVAFQCNALSRTTLTGFKAKGQWRNALAHRHAVE